MIRFVICVLGLSLLSGVTMAQKYVVELEHVAFDRDLTEAEIQQIHEFFQTPGSRVRSFGQERLRILRQKAKTKVALKATMLVGKETQSQRIETDSLVMQAHIRVIEAD